MKKIATMFIWFSAGLLTLTLFTSAIALSSKKAKADEPLYVATMNSKVTDVNNVVTSPWIVEVVDTTIFRNSVSTNSHFIVFKDEATAEEFVNKVNAESAHNPVGKKVPTLRRTAIRTYIDF